MTAAGSRRTGGEPSVKHVGVDAHKRFCRVCVKDRDGIILDEFNIPNGGGGFALLLDALDGEAKAVIESTGNPTGSPPLYTAPGGGGRQGAREPQDRGPQPRPG